MGKGLLSGLVAILDIAPSRVLASLGMGFISYAAISTAVNSMVSSFASNWASVGGEGLQLISLAGIPTGIGILIGCIIARVSLTSLPKLGKIT